MDDQRKLDAIYDLAAIMLELGRNLGVPNRVIGCALITAAKTLAEIGGPGECRAMAPVFHAAAECLEAMAAVIEVKGESVSSSTPDPKAN